MHSIDGDTIIGWACKGCGAVYKTIGAKEKCEARHDEELDEADRSAYNDAMEGQ